METQAKSLSMEKQEAWVEISVVENGLQKNIDHRRKENRDSKMDVLKIATLNARGGGNKIEEIINTIQKCANNVICLQEMHIVDDIGKRKIENICNGVLYRNNGTSQSRGVATFVKNQENMKQNGILKKDNVGRMLIVEIEWKSNSWVIFNLYAPNDSQQREAFFQDVKKNSQHFRGIIVYAGDFNCVLDRFLDRTKSDSKGATKSDKSRNSLRNMIGKENMVDSYRKIKPFGTAYTFTGPNGYRARLDRIYVSENMGNIIDSVDVHAIPYSDHDLMTVTFGKEYTREKWGTGRWMLSTKLLWDEVTKQEIEECVHYWRAHKMKFNSILEWWDNLKYKMKEVYAENGKRIQKNIQNERRTLESELENLIKREDIDEDDSEKISSIKNRLHEIEKNKIEASQIRSREDWIDKRENCTKYFYEEEKRRGTLKRMECLLDKEGKAVTSKEEVCRTAISFYKNLLTADPIDKHKLERLVNKNIHKKLSDEDRESIEGVITKEEILQAIKEMKNNRSPGLDGFTREFYVIMWDLIQNDLVDVITNIYLQERLPETWTEGLVTLIYKEKGDIRDLKNWRPITLLNTDYKIMTKTLANRIKKVAASIVNLDQSCSLKDRNIHDQLHYIRDFIHYFKEHKKIGLLITIDQEKAFDRVNHELIFKILEKFNFGPTVMNLVKTVYRQMSSRLQINGLITKPFNVSRSVRQGDGLSMILFVLVGELLSQMLRNEIEITPICLPNSRPKKLAQYADDISIMTDNDAAINSVIKTLDRYENITGAKINQDKTEILLIGPWTKNKKDKIPSRFKLYIKESIKILGIYFGKNSNNLNEQRLAKDLDNIFEKWKDKELSMSGKVSILRVLVLSKIWHTAKVIGLQRKFIVEINKKMANFFWYPKRHHCVNIQTLKNEREAGGMDFPDLEIEMEAYYLENIANALKHPEKQWVGMLQYRLGKLLEDILPKNRFRKVTDIQSPSSSIIKKAFPKAVGKIQNWSETDFRKIKKVIRENVNVTGPNGKNEGKIWMNIKKSSKSYKRVDLNYLAAHTRLPLANFLYQKGISKSNLCRLCYKVPETQQHLFFECCTIQDLKQILISDLRKNSGIQLTYDVLMTHTPVKSSYANEIMSIFKQSIWQLRGALYYTPKINNLRKELTAIYRAKSSRLKAQLPRTGIG